MTQKEDQKPSYLFRNNRFEETPAAVFIGFRETINGDEFPLFNIIHGERNVSSLGHSCRKDQLA